MKVSWAYYSYGYFRFTGYSILNGFEPDVNKLFAWFKNKSRQD